MAWTNFQLFGAGMQQRGTRDATLEALIYFVEAEAQS
jgi:hypothetical protein